MLLGSDGSFLQTALRIAAEYPDIRFESYIIDDLARRLISDAPGQDVLVMPNLYGDILSDAAAALVGGLGLAASGCYGDQYAYFESSHGSAPDIAGKNIINPTATILSGALMLDYLGFGDGSRRLTRAIEQVYAEGKAVTPDQGGFARTTEFCEAVAERL
jgi:isocitrate/isopropylmalate dehydrogenase